MTHTEANRALVRCLRLAMSAWARKWKYIHQDPVDRVQVAEALQNAVRLRNQARIWELYPTDL